MDVANSWSSSGNTKFLPGGSITSSSNKPSVTGVGEQDTASRPLTWNVVG